MIRFIDMHRDQFGVELICRVLKDAVRGFLGQVPWCGVTPVAS